MKKNLLSVFFAVMVFSTVFAQVPASFNYQAVVRNSSGEILANKTVSFKISLLQGSETGTVIYSETHSLSTNDYGLVNLKIGEGTKISGDFSPVGWGDVIFTKIEIDPAGGSSYSHLATTKLSSVPYAFKAQTVVNDAVDDADADSTNELQTLSLTETLLELSDGGSVTLPASPWSEDADGVFEAKVYYRGAKFIQIGDAVSPTIKTKSATYSAPAKLDIRTEGRTGLRVTSDAYSAMYVSNSGNGAAVRFISNSNNSPTANFYNNGSGGAARFNDPIQIKDGTEGDGRVLTSDANGVASWKSDLSVNDLTANGDVFINQNLEVADEITVANLDLSGTKITATTTGTSNNLLPFAYGTITNTGGKIGCTSNIGTVTRYNAGQFAVEIANLGSNYTVVVTPYGGSAFITGAVTYRGTTKFNASIWDTENNKYYDGGFSFIVYKP